MVDSRFWKKKRVFLTGHTGFKGSWLSLWLSLMGAEVTGYALESPSNPNLFTLLNIDNTIESITGDVTQFSTLSNALQKSKPEIVIHMAAQALVRASYKNPIETYQTNVMGTVNVLEAVRQIDSVKTLLNVTSDKCYANHQGVKGYRENDRLGGNDPYSNSKACSELVTLAYQKSFFQNTPVKISSARAGNVIGGGDWAKDRLIPDIIRSIFSDQPLIIRFPNAIRPWQHVLEPLNGYLILLEKMYDEGAIYTGEWNFGPSSENTQSVIEILEMVQQYWGEPIAFQIENQNLFPEADYLTLDSNKSCEMLQWKNRLSVEDTLNWTVTWYKKYYKNRDCIREFTEKQICLFMERS